MFVAESDPLHMASSEKQGYSQEGRDVRRFVYRCRGTSTDGTMFFCAPESEVKRMFCSLAETLHGSYADDPRLTWRHLVTDGDRRRLEASINQYV